MSDILAIVPPKISLRRQAVIGMVLAALIISVWTALHVYAVFFFQLPDVLGSFILVAGLTWLSVGLFIVAHDAMHGSLLPQYPKIGTAIGALALFLYAGFSFYRLLPKHHAHHKFSGQAEDPDFAPDNPSDVWTWYLRFTRTYFGLRELIVMTLRVWIYWWIGASFANILLFFALPGILSSLQLFYFGTYLPHHHDDDHHHDHETELPTAQFADHHNARSNDFNYFMSLLTCFHFGYHHEHHLKPGTPWWRLPAARKATAP